MSQHETTLATTSQTTTNGTKALLACGVLAGPLFIVVALMQLLTRDGFDIRRHPLSLLSVGDLGWVQIANFVAAGLLTVAFAVGIRRVLHPGRAGTWGPLLIGAFGLGLIAGGVFVTDPALGFPPGTPEGMPDDMSWHAVAHGIAPALAFDAVIVACLVFVRRFVALRQWRWVAYSAATAAAAVALTWWPNQDGISVRLALAVALAFVWTSSLALRLMRDVK
ncbi:MAG TPA: DUF998 domain-containing protein [Pilimelia sp.]|nr:DUF998 domain-containing protein [Pilimelia sp.]